MEEKKPKERVRAVSWKARWKKMPTQVNELLSRLVLAERDEAGS